VCSLPFAALTCLLAEWGISCWNMLKQKIENETNKDQWEFQHPRNRDRDRNIYAQNSKRKAIAIDHVHPCPNSYQRHHLNSDR